ncbi:hypothetical protein [uncultured Brevundimonas sp.]|uniref:hypothetical protein n=1 Tax=uncultured Brevundimonas sp. TaxID=213418 RepID=UPI002613FA7E|nr:hypothetical protein [uncultured Brevundimonas sp.]
MISADWPQILAWGLIAYGFGLWVWGWTVVKPPIIRLRYQDCGIAIVFASNLALYAIRDRELHFWDWFIVMFGPVFIGSAIWRLFRTQSYIKS